MEKRIKEACSSLHRTVRLHLWRTAVRSHEAGNTFPNRELPYSPEETPDEQAETSSHLKDSFRKGLQFLSAGQAYYRAPGK